MEPANSHPGIHQHRRRFVLLVHVLLVVDVVSRHLEDKRIVGSTATKAVETLRLVSPQSLGSEPVEVPVVGVL